MLAKAIRQAATPDCLFDVLSKWLRLGAGKDGHRIRLLTAFVTGGGVRAITPLLDLFFERGNTVEIIFGIDRNGTDKDAIRKLLSLQRAYPRQFDAWMFQAPSKGSIFHAKLYIRSARSKIACVVGSANLTRAGLATNLESLIGYEDIRSRSPFAVEIEAIWNTFAKPLSPLQTRFLQPLTGALAQRIISKLPDRSAEDPMTKVGRATSWRPASRIPGSPEKPNVGDRRPLGTAGINTYLLTDILDETRKTQVQIPLDVVERFFRIGRRRPATLSMSIMTSDGLTEPISRQLVLSQGPKRRRLMRRVEIPQIKRMKRPLAALFVKLSGRRNFAYVLLPRDFREYEVADKLLEKHGEQGGAERRYVIGNLNDAHWPNILKMIPHE